MNSGHQTAFLNRQRGDTWELGSIEVQAIGTHDRSDTNSFKKSYPKLHEFESVYWKRKKEWDFATAALQGSSFYKLPKVLQWFSGNIGFHHIHHLSARLPNYNLERCHRAEPLFQTVKPITLLSSLRSLRFRLWDEEQLRLVGFSALRERRTSMES